MRLFLGGEPPMLKTLTRRTRLAAVIGATLSLVGVLACTEITTLEQKNPSQLPANTLYTPGNAQLLVNGAISDFDCAYLRYVVGSGLLVDELADAIASTANYDYDRRTLPTNATYGTNTCAADENQQPGIY